MNERDIFLAALDKRPGTERDACLSELCGADVGLRQRIEVLLHAQDAAGSFLEKPAVDVDQTVDESKASVATVEISAIGSRIGPYKLLQKLGEGGMGTVFLAEQEAPVRRRVALKIIRAGFDSSHIIARFEAERQALALMDHPNIAKVLEAGTIGEPGASATGGRDGRQAPVQTPVADAPGSPRPYFVMELVKGIPITQYCDKEHLSPRERLELFIPVCQAVQHAHQKGIIHRDLKPSNVIVGLYDGKPIPKVIDFGVAKATAQKLTEKTLFTEVGQIVGTLEYMSPEQAELNNLDIDTRADIYSLGVILYELLTGSPPFSSKQLRNAAFTEMLRIIREVEPSKPSTKLSSSNELPSIAANRKLEPRRLTRLVTGDLDWIVMRCLEKERTRRYESANALARDLERYLTDEPVDAGPPSLRYRLGKMARKHRTLLATASAFAALLVLGVIGLIVGLVLVNKERIQKTAALDAKTRAQSQMRVSFDATHAVVRTLVRQKSNLSDDDVTVIRKVLTDYARNEPAFGDTKDARENYGEFHFLCAGLSAIVDDKDGAKAHYSRALQVYDSLNGDFPEEARNWSQLANAHFDRGILEQRQERREQAAEEYRQAVSLHERVAIQVPSESVHRLNLADDYNNLGTVLSEMLDYAGAAAAYQKAIPVYEELVAEFPNAVQYQVNLAGTTSNLGNAIRDLNRQRDALEYYNKAINALTAIVARESRVANGKSFLRNAHWDRANTFDQLRKHAEAVADWQRALEMDDGSGQSALQLFLAASQLELRVEKEVKPENAAATGELVFRAAQSCARAAAAAASQKTEPALENHFTNRSNEFLSQAKTAGFFRDRKRIDELKKDPAFELLRQGNAAFREFMTQLESGGK